MIMSKKEMVDECDCVFCVNADMIDRKFPENKMHSGKEVLAHADGMMTALCMFIASMDEETAQHAALSVMRGFNPTLFAMRLRFLRDRDGGTIH
jgi:hypothetical protein